MRIVTAAEMRAIDAATAEAGTSLLQLMENAGRAVAEHVLEAYPSAEKICVLCGRGNNGGDGSVTARVLAQQGKKVDIFLLARPDEVKGAAAEMLSRLPRPPVPVAREQELPQLEGYDLVVDALLGTGARLPLEGVYAAAVQLINDCGSPVVAVDIPSGVEADERKRADAMTVRASSIVTFTALKPAHVFQAGETPTLVKGIGSSEEIIAAHAPSNLHHITPADFAAMLAPRGAETHKGYFGHVLVLGGSPGKAGAPALTAMAALRCGAGLVTVGSPKSVQPTVASFSPELMTVAMAENELGDFSILALESLRKSGITNGKDAIAIGPGLSRDKEAAQFARSAIDKTEVPVVLDADGLNAFEGRVQELKMRNLDRILVLTPHPGEMARLLGTTVDKVQADREGTAREFAKAHHCYVVLKGHQTVVAEPSGKVWINTTGNPGMATGGTGDILSGMIAALLAKRKTVPSEAVIAAVYLHGLAGDIARDEMGEISLTATDLLMALPHAILHTQGVLSD
ncbi:MAG TPA: NAD(P)H-hydrate dehydratase [Terriglobales bacterium]|nr:NAD(P)H-hydrate dehydratase [Terriglobales bacterium]